ncbi:DUF1553 domain-containing protein [Roseiconus nitratireducens]|uniref:DUF1553 domain-containing protein n=1 Tax=Roseiconus nitratireducens TaxID=2605748 RepID=A0A5M6DM82_9BACT|nr:DUF1553 domain-containing protein [Roseiconus nitratireducens]
MQPILKRHCDRCHGESAQEGSLVLFRRDAVLGVADSGVPIVVPEQPDRSLLIERVTDASAGDLMPLDGQPLSRTEVNVLREWIRDGAEMPDVSGTEHWAYQAPSVDPQALRQASQRNLSPIDYFVEQKRIRSGLPSPSLADPATLARRVSLALTGLPATLQQIDDLQRDPSEENYRRLVDELLASDAFGVHWARHWLDLARYADSNGFQADQLRSSWAYRDWVVDAFNRDKPFDQFAIEQLAGDLLPDANLQTRIATGFHRTPTCNVEAGVQPEANRVQQVFDRVNTTATVFLGSTIECAQCHDHKYDPFTQEDYYRLFAYFNNTPLEVEKASGVRFDFVGPTMDLPLTDEQAARRKQLQKQITSLRAKQDALGGEDRFQAWRTQVSEALRQGRARWLTPTPHFSSTGEEPFQVLDDQSVLLQGNPPGSTEYRFSYDDLEGPILGVRLDALQHDDLPGRGPGRGDAKRTNFVLHDLQMRVETGKKRHLISLADAKASFSQSKYDVAGAIDGDPKTAWAIAPKFDQPHWATFRTTEPVDAPRADQRLVVTLDQHFGRGRVIGRPKVSFLIGPPETVGLTDEIAQLLGKATPLEAAEIEQLRTFFLANDPETRDPERKIRALVSRRDRIQPETTLVMVEQPESRETFVMRRGDYLSPGEPVSPGTPSALHPADADLPPNRLGLARWLVDPDNPLLARVTVNRFWAEVFGRGIVATPEDFGTQADAPTHPELLDWLALEFQSEGWSVKSLLRTMVLSETFRSSSVVTARAAELDPDNRLLSRGPRFRLPAETLRDNALAISGLLCREGAGEPVMPFQPDGIWRAVGRNQPQWTAAQDQDRYRRGLYVVWKRSAPYPSFVTFDAPDRAACTVQRPRTNTPLQALVLLNDHAYAEAAVGLAQRMVLESGSDDPREVAAYGYRIATGREPSLSAVESLLALFESQSALLAENPDLVDQRIGVLPESFLDPAFASGADASEAKRRLGAWYAVANALLNLDQTITLN